MRDDQSQEPLGDDRWAGIDLPGVDARELEHLLGMPEIWATPSPDLEERCLTARELPRSGGADVVPFSRSRERTGGRPRRVVLLAAAAAVVIAGATGVVSALVAPEPRTFALSGTGPAVGASARAELRDTSSGVEITLRTSGLQGAPPGTYYEAWVKGEKGLVPIGTFHLRGGSDRIVLWSGVDLAAYPTMTVTVQPEGGGTASSGRVVLSGAVPPSQR